jgi:mannosyl-oligosaccharide alpha-1,2-mannosidase
MRLSAICLAAAVLTASVTAWPNIRDSSFKKRDRSSSPREGRIDFVKEAFRRSWSSYRKYAWGHDSLRPISNSWYDDRCVMNMDNHSKKKKKSPSLALTRYRNGWGASAIDALSTAIVMEEAEVVKDILLFVQTVDFRKTDMDVSLFETTIRYLGGLISGMKPSKCQHHLLPGKLTLAKDTIC